MFDIVCHSYDRYGLVAPANISVNCTSSVFSLCIQTRSRNRRNRLPTQRRSPCGGGAHFRLPAAPPRAARPRPPRSLALCRVRRCPGTSNRLLFFHRASPCAAADRRLSVLSRTVGGPGRAQTAARKMLFVALRTARNWLRTYYKVFAAPRRISYETSVVLLLRYEGTHMHGATIDVTGTFL